MVKTDKLTPNVGPATPTLQEKEAAKVAQQNTQRIASQDAARLAQQAGFQRGARVNKKGFDVGDSTHAPIPLPNDDLNKEVWSTEGLEAAREHLGLASAQFSDLSQSTEPAGLAEVVASSSFLPIEEDVGKLQELADKKGDNPAESALKEVTSDVNRLFHINLPPEVPVGHKVLATGLVVAGESEMVDVVKGGINEKKLAAGLHKVAEKGSQAVDQAKSMSVGVEKQVQTYRTHIPKR